MAKPSTVWRFAKDFGRAFVAEARQFVAPTYDIEIVEQDELRLVLRAQGREIVVNRRHRTVKSGSEVLARFDAVRHIEVVHVRDDDAGDTWRVRLYRSWFNSIHIGRTSDATEASIVGARLSTIIGKPVRAIA